ncbi:unnamed protein product [Closterium sp. NIES-53]
MFVHACSCPLAHACSCSFKGSCCMGLLVFYFAHLPPCPSSLPPPSLAPQYSSGYGPWVHPPSTLLPYLLPNIPPSRPPSLPPTLPSLFSLPTHQQQQFYHPQHSTAEHTRPHSIPSSLPPFLSTHQRQQVHCQQR